MMADVLHNQLLAFLQVLISRTVYAVATRLATTFLIHDLSA